MAKIQRKVLENGMVVLFEKRNLPVVSVAFASKAGGINESVSEKGISHYIEHMLYKGTPKRDAKKIAEEIEKNGGVLNGFTDEDLTAFWCKMPSKHLRTALEVLGDMVQNPVFDEKELEKERKVIFEEMKMRKDNPGIYVFDKLGSLLYEPPFGISLIGTEKTMGSIDREKIIDKFKKLYQPSNMILCVVGKANFNEIVKFAEKKFSSKKAEVPKQKIVAINKSQIEKRTGIDQANLVFAYHVPKIKDKKIYASMVLNTLLAGGMSSRLFTEIREKRNLAYSIRGGLDTGKDYGHAYIYVGTSKENVSKVKELIIEEFKKVAQGFSEKELAQVKEQIIGNYKISTEDSYAQMINLLYSETFDNIKNYEKYEKYISEVKIKEIQELAKKAIEKYSFFALVPK
ncbi:MAG TPA: pitrilysin family protein [Candidatus Pacearchaeota archaeon]|nr:pitrilysin family protein [Candidatus Pacearchaeota archaeon]